MDVPDYDLPEEAIAQFPAEPRDSSRLLVALGARAGAGEVGASGQAVRHLRVSDLPTLLGEGDVLVVNTSRVVPARLKLRKVTGGVAEVLLLEPLPGDLRAWEALVRPGRRLAPGARLYWGEEAVVEVGDRLRDGNRVVKSLVDDLTAYGSVALPPYIHEALADPERYQTVYCDRPGSVAAPTAGLHITERVLDECRSRGVTVAFVDLAVGLGTFRPIKTEQVEAHSMHAERYRVPEETWQACRSARRVVAVGTTTTRALESAAATGLLEGRTELYMRPGHDFRLVDVLMTNFHQPRSTLLVLLEAFMGPGWRDLYRVALAEGYRFLSFGDAMVVGRHVPA
jgi:S-adenosylmethionine:tRNA ribosyltransferase-isomerase